MKNPKTAEKPDTENPPPNKVAEATNKRERKQRFQKGQEVTK